jgi:hypothetical protein
MMLKLRPLVVVTGTIHVEGGEKSAVVNRVKQAKRPKRAQGKTMITKEQEISPERQEANVIVVNYSRRLRRFVLLRTPFGLLLDPNEQHAVEERTRTTLELIQELSAEVTRKAIEFNKTAGGECALMNCWLIEPLAGPRKAAVEGWIARRLHDKDPAILQVMPGLAPAPAPARPAPASNVAS